MRVPGRNKKEPEEPYKRGYRTMAGRKFLPSGETEAQRRLVSCMGIIKL